MRGKDQRDGRPAVRCMETSILGTQVKYECGT